MPILLTLNSQTSHIQHVQTFIIIENMNLYLTTHNNQYIWINGIQLDNWIWMIGHLRLFMSIWFNWNWINHKNVEDFHSKTVARMRCPFLRSVKHWFAINWKWWIPHFINIEMRLFIIPIEYLLLFMQPATSDRNPYWMSNAVDSG